MDAPVNAALLAIALAWRWGVGRLLRGWGERVTGRRGAFDHPALDLLIGLLAGWLGVRRMVGGDHARRRRRSAAPPVRPRGTARRRGDWRPGDRAPARELATVPPAPAHADSTRDDRGSVPGAGAARDLHVHVRDHRPGPARGLGRRNRPPGRRAESLRGHRRGHRLPARVPCARGVDLRHHRVAGDRPSTCSRCSPRSWSWR